MKKARARATHEEHKVTPHDGSHNDLTTGCQGVVIFQVVRQQIGHAQIMLPYQGLHSGGGGGRERSGNKLLVVFWQEVGWRGRDRARRRGGVCYTMRRERFRHILPIR